MPTIAPTSRRVLTWGLSAYAASTLVSMAVMSIGIGALLVALGVSMGSFALFGRELRAAALRPWMKRYLWLSLGLVVACVISLLVAIAAPVGWGGDFVHPQFWGDIAKVWYFIWPLVLVVALRQVGEDGRRVVVRTWLIAFGVVSVIGVIQYFTGWPRLQAIPGNPGRFHATIFLGHHLSVASILIFPFFACLDFIKRPALIRMRPWVLVSFALIGFATLFFTYSRMLWIALPVGIVLWALRALPRKQTWAAVTLMAVGLAGASQIPQIRTRIADSIGTQDRWKLWSANLELFKLRPITGVGFRRNNEASSIYLHHQPNAGDVFTGHAHNNGLDMMAGMGLIGLLTWLAWCVFGFVILRQVLKRPESNATFAWGLFCAWVVFQLNGLTQVNFWEGKVMHQMMWVMAWALLWVDHAEA